MIELIEAPPTDWRALQERTAQILRESGFDATTDVPVALARGSVNVDVRAEDSMRAPPMTLLCECKQWKKKVTKSTVHSFRTVMADSGADSGLIISAAGFQSGAVEAAQATNVRLVTWESFQTIFVDRWFESYFSPAVRQRASKLVGYAEPTPSGPRELSGASYDEWISVHHRSMPVGWVIGHLWSTASAARNTSERTRFFEYVEKNRQHLPAEFFAQRTLRDLFDYVAGLNDTLVASAIEIAAKYPAISEEAPRMGARERFESAWRRIEIAVMKLIQFPGSEPRPMAVWQNGVKILRKFSGYPLAERLEEAQRIHGLVVQSQDRVTEEQASSVERLADDIDAIKKSSAS